MKLEVEQYPQNSELTQAWGDLFWGCSAQSNNYKLEVIKRSRSVDFIWNLSPRYSFVRQPL